MKAEKLTLERVFERNERLEAPLFQRPYVWNCEDNWEPLWESLRSVADKRLISRSARPHFMGTIVLDQLKTPMGRIHARQIIDGQQRLTTLQIALASIRDYCLELGKQDYVEAFKALTNNRVPPKSEDPNEQFKVWPTNADRDDFRDVMNAGAHAVVRDLPHSDHHDEWLIPDAYLYFSQSIRDWLGELGATEFDHRLDVLYTSMRDYLHLVVIDLETEDDAQEIFETLNARGTPLLPADLVKNFLFHEAEFQKADTVKLYNSYWAEFDTEKSFWRERVRQGRLKRPRLDFFLYHFLTLITRDDVSATNLFTLYRDHVRQNGQHTAAEHMAVFKAYADVYRVFDDPPDGSFEALFFYRLQQLETTTVYPLLLEVFKRHSDDTHEIRQVLGDLESFLVRRMICQLTGKSYTRFFTDLIKRCSNIDDFTSHAIRSALLEETAESSRWPDDHEFGSAWKTIAFYRRLKKSRQRMIFEAIDAAMFTGKTEAGQIERGLTVEHLMPREWEEHWPLPETSTFADGREEAVDHRNECIHRIGNLTLVTKRLNPALSNAAWTKKREEILKHSKLNLNRAFHTVDQWDENAIEQRSNDLLKYALKLWPHPQSAKNTK